MAWQCLVMTWVLLCSCSVVTIEPPELIPNYAYVPNIDQTSLPKDWLYKPIEAGRAVPSQSTLIPLESWSLFLVCNLAWLGRGNTDKINVLYEQFQAFGRAIGPKHLAVWFWKRGRSRSNPSKFDMFLAAQSKATPQQLDSGKFSVRFTHAVSSPG
jgi:hypothetical protein